MNWPDENKPMCP